MTDAILDTLRQARFDDAATQIAALATQDAEAARELGAMLTVLKQPFTYGLVPMFDTAAPDAEPTQRSLLAVQSAVRRVGGRIAAIREHLVGHLGELAWLPDPTPLEPQADGTLKLDDVKDDALHLLWILRQEWTRLNWLLACSGARELGVPAVVGKPPEPLDYLDTLLSARFNLLLDRSEERELTLEDELDKGMAESRWGGEKGAVLATLSPSLANVWMEETGAAIAAIRWAEGEQDSPFDAPDSQ